MPWGDNGPDCSPEYEERERKWREAGSPRTSQRDGITRYSPGAQELDVPANEWAKIEERAQNDPMFFHVVRSVMCGNMTKGQGLVVLALALAANRDALQKMALACLEQHSQIRQTTGPK